MKSVLRKELVCLRRDGRIRLTAALFAALLIGAVALGIVEHRAYEEQRHAAEESDRELWVKQGEKDAHSASHYGQYVFRPRSDLHWMDRGVDDLMGTTTLLESHKLGKEGNSAVEARAWAPPFVDLSPSNLILVILPLIALVLGHGIWNGERAAGTLATTIATGADPRLLLRGKVIAVLIVTGLLVSVAVLIGLFGVLMQDGELGDGLARLTLLTLTYAACTLIYSLLGVLASVVIRSRAKSLLAVLACWALTMILMPRVINSLANQNHPLPMQSTIDEMVNDMRVNGINGDDPRTERRARVKTEALKKYGVSDIDDLPVNFSGLSLQAREDYDNLIFDHLEETLHARKEKRNKARRWVYAFSPSAAAWALSRLGAGTDEAHHMWFEDRIEASRRSYVKALNDNLAFETTESEEAEEEGHQEELWEKTAVGPIPTAKLSDVIHFATLPAMALIAWVVIAMLAFAYVWRRADRDPVTLGD